ncbi:MAG TPA: hypothetical protein VMU22_12830 [Rhizomicrobium sp.]|nr:hypothetical protein [Rhizomicrobium sp.]
MMSELVPDDVRNFIIEHIDTVADLEALLLLRKNTKEPWTAQLVSKRLYVDEATATRVLSSLAVKGLCEKNNDVYRYQPRSDETRHLVDRLAEAYDLYLIPVTNFIHQKPSRIQHFADAFRIRKDK